MTKRIDVIYLAKAQKDLRKFDAVASKKIVLKINQLAHRADPLTGAKALQGALTGKYRYRIGDYRAIFILDKDGRIVLLTILTIKHRKDVYR